jgi:hypothetical protein
VKHRGAVRWPGWINWAGFSDPITASSYNERREKQASQAPDKSRIIAEKYD